MPKKIKKLDAKQLVPQSTEVEKRSNDDEVHCPDRETGESDKAVKIGKLSACFIIVTKFIQDS